MSTAGDSPSTGDPLKPVYDVPFVNGWHITKFEGSRVRIPCTLETKDPVCARVRTTDGRHVRIFTLTAFRRDSNKDKIVMQEWPSRFALVEGVVYDEGDVVVALSIKPLGVTDGGLINDLIDWAHGRDWLHNDGRPTSNNPFSDPSSSKTELITKVIRAFST
ncbi:hypothetical protein NP233_g12252 [Leucocoprinus birnbaumii]|uniref:Uncharacterized protein n=1 Tax=Leucocoprinus birnbaumii TaxID=56174 RepID=A0AAD5YQ60_9AGAR|nr:hypothetical protein NP233_g12252 [Leucocoprinus birnbaumii]